MPSESPIMHSLLRSKFFDHPDMARRLLDTGDARLVEGNTWGDTFWGVCRDTATTISVGSSWMFDPNGPPRRHLATSAARPSRIVRGR